ncbi:oxidoreductase-like protein [Angomonas deanei]|uniref:Oxidoreductase family, NAD-binding Rossmann fold, putative n=1 Tax=Angomonas deanei TaxID=59799 RepID=S9UKF0_9TRYP|nr:oxidoreductase-like protein [Angomonas deanei]EPY40446.1 oxidoreductase-like protein [Angomonas deanei]CAD2219173.1 Oxidoreductase family, NAD-binding Rossmann fold, putative [Angomonas deanei]|eukprot:EPY29254.1 oxidoreductase-like protein [Angomonas deanei]
MSDKIRVGFIGASSIGCKVWNAIHAAGLVVVLVGSRSRESAEKYIQTCSESLGINPQDASPATYDEVVTSDKVDVVYMSIPVTQRDEWIRKCAANGKHVVSEKPHLSASALLTYAELLAEKQLLFMDGTMFSHGPYIQAVMDNLPKIGTVRRINALFSFLNENSADIRLNPAMEPMGALGDVGWYSVRFMLHIMNFEMPTSVTGRIVKSAENGAIVSFSGELTFVNKETGGLVTGSFFATFDAHQNDFYVSGTDGIIEAPNMILPVCKSKGGVNSVRVVTGSATAEGTELVSRRHEERIAVPEEDGHTQETQMWRDVQRALHREDSGALVVAKEDAEKWFKMAWITQSILDKLVESAKKK